MAHMVFLKGKKVNLRPYDKLLDLENCQKWINDPEIRRYIHNNFPMTLEQEEKELSRLSSTPHTIFFIIETSAGTSIGVMGLHNIDWVSRTAVSGAFIGEKDFWNLGYGTEAKMLLLDYAFNTLNLHKITPDVLSFNKRSVAYNLRCGYRIEGRRKRQVYRNGRYRDLILLAIFKKDFLKAKEENKFSVS